MRTLFIAVAFAAIWSLTDASKIRKLASVQGEVGSGSADGEGSGNGNANGGARGGSASGSGNGDGGVTINVDDCTWPPFATQPYIVIATGSDCGGVVTFTFTGLSNPDGSAGPCEGPSTWRFNNSFTDPLTNETGWELAETSIWAVTSVQSTGAKTKRTPSDPLPYCNMVATFAFFTDSQCTSAFPVATDGLNKILADENFAICVNATGGGYRPEIGGWRVSAANGLLKSSSILVLFLAVLAAKFASSF